MHKTSIAGLCAALAVAGLATAAAAQDAKARVDSAKAAGMVGEQADGFLGVVSGGDPAVAQAVQEINAGRAQVYREAAARNGVTPAAAGASAFENVIRGKIPPGQFYKPAGGGWVKK